MASSEVPGFIDTNVFVHALTRDSLSRECTRFLAALEDGHLSARMHPLVLHELTYALRHYLRDPTQNEIADYLLAILAWPGIMGEKGLMAAAVGRWRARRALGFVDAFLIEEALAQGAGVYTKNLRDFRGLGLELPDPLIG